MSLSVDELSKRAEGDVKAKTLSKTEGIIFTYLYDKPLQDYFQEKEQPEYVFKNNSRGFKIISEESTVRTPHHDGAEGDRYLLFTDQRVIYVAGVKEGDEYAAFPYKAFSKVEVLHKTSILLHGRDGTTYKFSPAAKFGTAMKNAVDYANKKIAPMENDNGLSGTTDVAITIDANFPITDDELQKVCRECKSKVTKDVQKCPHCGWKPKKRGGLWWGTTAVMSLNPIGWAMGAKGASDAHKASKGVWEETEIHDKEQDSRLEDPIVALERLKELLDREVITKDEFEAKKSELLDEF